VFKKEFLVSSSSGLNERLDVFLSRQVQELTRSHLQRLIDEDKVKVNGTFRKASYKLKNGDRVELEFETPEESEKIEPEDIPLNILYSDNHIVVLNKPAGLVVHPGAGHMRGTLASGLLFHYPEVKNIGHEERPGIVQRLDKKTSGVMVIARSRNAYIELQRQFRKRQVKKVYLGLIWGKMPEKEGKITWSLGRHIKHGLRMSVKTRKPREAETHYRMLKEFMNFTLLEIKPVTGRTHQIRVHLSAAGHPVVGDDIYGRRKGNKKFPGLFLHSYRLAFTHPETGERVEFSAPLPEDLKNVLDSLK
jgi:23S rRNA pseudouridine1911/1915/1917 synthase